MPDDSPPAPTSRATRASPEWLSPADVARRLSVSAWQVRKWVEAGQFDEIAVFSKKLTRISRPAYDRFVAKNRRATA